MFDAVRRGDVLSVWSGIRPLVLNPEKKDTQSIARNHIIEVSDTKLITIAGAWQVQVLACRCRFYQAGATRSMKFKLTGRVQLYLVSCGKVTRAVLLS